jgi:hypothetical protein
MGTLSASRLDPWTDRITYAVIVAYSLAMWWPTRALPYYWDTATFVVNGARDLRATGFDPLVVAHSDFAHPPLFVALVAAAWSIFGDSRVVAHALTLPALPAAMVATYRLGIRIADRAVGAAAAFLFGGAAVVLTEVGQVYMDLPIGALLAWGLLAWVSGRRAWASVLFSVAALVKIPAPLTVPAALMLVMLASRDRRADVRSYIALAVPFAVDALWLAYHAAVTGWVLWRPGFVLPAPQSVVDRSRNLGLVFEWLLLDQWRWVVLVSAVVAIVWRRLSVGSREKSASDRGPLAPLVVPIAVSLLLFANVGVFGLRYGVYLLPPYFVACLAVVRGALGRRGGVWLGGGSALLFVAFATTWHPKDPLTSSYVYKPDENLAYQDLIAIGRRSARWLEDEHPDAEIYGAGPEAYELAEPWQGYVTRPLRFAWCDHFARHAGTEQLVVVHGYHPQQPLCRQLVQTLGAEALIRFETNSKWLEVYQVPAM